jgi:hypothetical protein
VMCVRWSLRPITRECERVKRNTITVVDIRVTHCLMSIADLLPIGRMCSLDATDHIKLQHTVLKLR